VLEATRNDRMDRHPTDDLISQYLIQSEPYYRPTGSEVELYEAAVVDGAGSWQRLWHVTLPGIRSVIVLLLILRLGTALTVGFEQYYLQRGSLGAQAAEVLDTFIYFRGIQGGDWGFATAVGLVRGVIGTVLIVLANAGAKRFGEEGIY